MVKSFIGQNSFLLGSALKKAKQEFLAEYGDFSLETVDVSEAELGKILDIASALPFLSARRMVIFEGLAANKPAGEAVQKIIDAVSDSTDLYVVEPKMDKRSVLYKTLKKQTELIEFTELDPRDAPKWLVGEAKLLGGSISMGDAAYLVARVGPGQQLLSSELTKLLLYDEVVSRKTIDLLTEQAPLSSIFDLIEAAFSGDIKRALALYDDQRAQNVEPLAIEALFVWQLHILVLLKAAGQKSPDAVAADSGISPYVAKKSVGLANRRSFLQLKNYVIKLAQTEYDMKSITIDSDDAMKNYIVLLGA